MKISMRPRGLQEPEVKGRIEEKTVETEAPMQLPGTHTDADENQNSEAVEI